MKIKLTLGLFFLSLQAIAETLPAPKLSCDLTQQAHLPKLILVGEIHSNKQSIALRKELFSRASKQHFPLASEITSFGDAFVEGKDRKQKAVLSPELNNANIHALDHVEFNGATASYFIQKLFLIRDNLPLDTRTKNDFFDHLIGNFSTLDALEHMDGHPKAKKIAAILREINRMEESANRFASQGKVKETKEASQKSDALTKSIPTLFQSDAEIIAFQNELHRTIVQRLNEKQIVPFDKKPFIPLTKDNYDDNLDTIVTQQTNRKKMLERSQKIWDGHSSNFLLTYHYREYFMAKRIAQLLCQYAGKQNKLYALTGVDHSEAIVQWLREWSKNKIIIKFFQSAQHTQVQIFEQTTKPPPAEENTPAEVR